MAITGQWLSENNKHEENKQYICFTKNCSAVGNEEPNSSTKCCWLAGNCPLLVLGKLTINLFTTAEVEEQRRRPDKQQSPLFYTENCYLSTNKQRWTPLNWIISFLSAHTDIHPSTQPAAKHPNTHSNLPLPVTGGGLQTTFMRIINPLTIYLN